MLHLLVHLLVLVLVHLLVLLLRFFVLLSSALAPRIHTYKALEEEVQNDDLVWAYLPYSMKMAGPREVIQHMIIRKNFGATHFIIGRDMAGTKSTITGEDYYGPYEAHELAMKYEDEVSSHCLASS